MAATFAGTWKLTDSKNFDEYMKSLGKRLGMLGRGRTASPPAAAGVRGGVPGLNPATWVPRCTHVGKRYVRRGQGVSVRKKSDLEDDSSRKWETRCGGEEQEPAGLGIGHCGYSKGNEADRQCRGPQEKGDVGAGGI